MNQSKSNVYCGGSFPFDIKYIRKFVQDHGYLLLSKEYKNRNSLITVRCKKGHVKTLQYQTFHGKVTQNKYCRECHNESLKLDFNIFINKAKERGHIIMSPAKDYKNAKSKIKIKCQDGHVFKTTWDSYAIKTKDSPRSNGCRECGIIKNSLDGNYNYKGYSIVKTWMRRRLYTWKRQAMEKHNYLCYITGKNGQFEIHHPHNFNDIFYNAIKKLKLPNLLLLKGYTEEQLFALEALVIKLHDQEGVPMLKHIHKLFHNIYGTKNNTPAQIEDFKQNYKLRKAV